MVLDVSPKNDSNLKLGSAIRFGCPVRTLRTDAAVEGSSWSKSFVRFNRQKGASSVGVLCWELWREWHHLLSMRGRNVMPMATQTNCNPVCMKGRISTDTAR